MHQRRQTSFRGDPFAVIADANNCTYHRRVSDHSNIADTTSESIISYEDLTAFESFILQLATKAATRFFFLLMQLFISVANNANNNFLSAMGSVAGKYGFDPFWKSARNGSFHE